jgi:hypothetical protein
MKQSLDRMMVFSFTHSQSVEMKKLKNHGLRSVSYLILINVFHSLLLLLTTSLPLHIYLYHVSYVDYSVQVQTVRELMFIPRGFFFSFSFSSFLACSSAKTKPKIWESDVPITKAVFANSGDGFACGFANGVIQVSFFFFFFLFSLRLHIHHDFLFILFLYYFFLLGLSRTT